MIAFNGQYLPAASHGNMRITDACLGGQWVIGGKWLTHATQQAIIAAFGAEGTEVIVKTNDYLNRIATTDPQRAQQLAMFIQEDPLLVTSLVETSKVRGIYTNGSAYAKTDIVPDSTTKVSTYAKRADTGNYKYIFGSQGSAGKSSYYFFGANNSNWYCEVKGSNMNFGSALQDVRYKIEFSLEKAVIDGTEYTIGATTLGTNTVPMAIGRCINASGASYNNPWIGSIDKEFIIEKGGAAVAHFVPFKRNGEMELLDILTGTLATRVGTFTEQLTDKTHA